MTGAIYAFGALLAVIVILSAVLIIRVAKRRGDWERENSVSLTERLDRALGAGLAQPSAVKKVVPRSAPPAAPVSPPAPSPGDEAPPLAPRPPADDAPAPGEYRLDGPVQLSFAGEPAKVSVRPGTETASAFRHLADELISLIRNADT